MTTPIISHLIAIDKVTEILCSVGWQRWAKSRAEQQILAGDLIALRDFLEGEQDRRQLMKIEDHF